MSNPEPVAPRTLLAAALALNGMAHDLVPGIRHDFGLAALDYLDAYPEHKAAIGAFCAPPPTPDSLRAAPTPNSSPTVDDLTPLSDGEFLRRHEQASRRIAETWFFAGVSFGALLMAVLLFVVGALRG